MTLGERIYEAKSRWDCSFVQIAFLLDMKKEKVADIYHQECIKRRELHTITPDSYIEDCFILSTRTINLLKRHRIRTIGHLIKVKSIFDVNFAGAGMKTIAEILDASRRARKELAANDSTRASN